MEFSWITDGIRITCPRLIGMNRLKLILFALLLAGCSTTTKYEAKAPGGEARPAKYPIYIYTENVKVPRAFEIIGTMRVSDTPFTVMGGSLEKVLNKLRDNARTKGADALQIKAIRKPDFLSPNYGAEAHFLRFTDQWESLALTKEGLEAYFQTNRAALDPIEGLWSGSDTAQSRVVILKNNSKPGRDLVALIVGTKNPSWQTGDKKMDLARGERPGVYRGNYYQDDYQAKQVAFTLRGSATNRIVLQLSEDGEFTVFNRAMPVSRE